MIHLRENENYNIIIIGTGGTGSHLVSFLCQLIGNNEDFKKRHTITLVDGDIVEEKNLRTQKFLLEDVDRLKAEVLAERYSSVFGVNIRYVDKYIETEEDLMRLSTNATDLIVSCVDNNKARKIIDNVFNKKIIHKYEYRFSSMIYIDTGNSSGSEELTGQTVVAYKKEGNIILPSVSTYFPSMLNEEEEEEELVQAVSCGEELVHNIQNIGANITSACNTFNIINNIIGFHQITSDLVTFNATTLNTENMAININNDN